MAEEKKLKDAEDKRLREIKLAEEKKRKEEEEEKARLEQLEKERLEQAERDRLAKEEQELAETIERQKQLQNEEKLDENASSSGLIIGIVTGGVIVFLGAGGTFIAKRNGKSKDPKDDSD